MATKFIEAGSDSTFGLEFWDATAGTVTSDSTAIGQHGPRSIKMDGDDSASVRKNGIMADAGRRVSFWIYFDTLSSGLDRLVLILTSGSLEVLQLAFDGTAGANQNQLVVTNVTQSFFKYGTTVFSAATWYRISLAYVITSTTNFTFKIFVNGTLEITVTQADATLLNTASADLTIGNPAGIGTSTTHLDSVYVDDSTALTDPGDIRVTAKLPTTTTQNAFATTNGTGAVNERPISTTNNKAETGTTAHQQFYNIEAASAGDVNITGATIIDSMGWIWSKSGTGSAGTPKIRFNGVDTAVVLSSAAYGLFTKFAASSTYPTDVGETSSGASADTFLAECGVMIAYIPAAAVLAPKPYIQPNQAVQRAATR